MNPSHTAVLHPLHAPGLTAKLALIKDVIIESASDADGVVAALQAGTTILLTYVWEDRFLTGSLRWIQAISAGIEQFPIAELRTRGVRLTSARGAHAPAVAEHAIALLMATVRRIGPAIRNAEARAWTPLPAHEIAGRTLGVLGLGAIGEAVALRATALGMRVIGTKRHPISTAESPTKCSVPGRHSRSAKPPMLLSSHFLMPRIRQGSSDQRSSLHWAKDG